jgi:predicted DNA binding protein
MTVEGVFELAGDELLFGELADGSKPLLLEVERVVPAGDQVMPYVWVSGQSGESFEDRARERGGVDSVRLLDRAGDRELYRIEWSRDTEQFVSGILDAGGTIIEARGSTDWTFRIRFEDRSDLATFRAHCRAHDIDSRLRQVREQAKKTATAREFGLTDAQREGLTVAFDRGYFEVPREVTLDELAAELDVSPQAVSDRIRRGLKKILTATLNGSI